MTGRSNILFPFILDTLNKKPMLSETQENLLRDLKEKLNSEGITVPNLKKELDAAIEIGQDLGILTLNDEEVRVRFLLNDLRMSRARRNAAEPGKWNKDKQNSNESFTEPQHKKHSRRSRSRSSRRRRSRSRSRRHRRRRMR